VSVNTIRFADLHSYVGKFLGTSGWTIIGQAQIDQFGALTGDDEWIHIEVDRATQEMGSTIVHGYHLMSLIPLLSKQIFHIEGSNHGLNYGIDRLRFIQKVRPGDSLRLHETLLSTSCRGDAVMMTVEARVEIKDNPRPAMIANCLFLLFPDVPDGPTAMSQIA
jgi:acyl dehydratase